MDKNDLLHTARDLEDPISIPIERVMKALRLGEVHHELGLMRWGSNYTFLVNVVHEDLRFLGVYKPRMGERPLWDFPDGTLCQRETASYYVSEALGWGIVPPTVLRDGSRGVGSIQAFIDHDPNRHYFTFDESHIPQLQLFQAFDAIINNADRKGGHCLLDTDNRIWGIDQGLSFNVAHKLRTVIWDFAGQKITQPILTDIEAFCKQLDDCDSKLRLQLGTLLGDGEIVALQRRVQRLLDTGHYPLPGPGPNRPWPAV